MCKCPKGLYTREHNDQLINCWILGFSLFNYLESNQMIIGPTLAQREKSCIHLGRGPDIQLKKNSRQPC